MKNWVAEGIASKLMTLMGTVAHHRKLEEIYNLGTIQTQED